jgi:prepilin peptidase CpaA
MTADSTQVGSPFVRRTASSVTSQFVCPLEIVPSSVFRSALLAMLPLLLGAAAWCDLRWRRIPNVLTGIVALLGLYVVATGAGPATVWGGLGAAAVSLLAGVLLHSLRLFGGGDVKLFAATAIWLGPVPTVTAALATAIAGGILGIAFLRSRPAASPETSGDAPAPLASRVARRFQLDEGHDRERVPYGVAIAAGSMWTWWRLIASLGGTA